jgi:hypothetical protein
MGMRETNRFFFFRLHKQLFQFSVHVCCVNVSGGLKMNKFLVIFVIFAISGILAQQAEKITIDVCGPDFESML